MALAGYLANVMSRINRVPVETTPAHLDLPYEDVTFPAREDGLTIRGWLIHGRKDGSYIVLVHGAQRHRADSGVDTLRLTQSLQQNGYNVLMFDLRGHGESEGKRRLSGGHYERRDLLGAVDYLTGRGVALERIGFLGFSIGAVLSLITAREAGVRAVVADSAFCDMQEVIRQRSGKSRSVFLLLPGMLLISRLFYGISVKRVRPLQAVRELDFPVLFIHGEADTGIPVSHSVRLAQAAQQQPGSHLWVVPGVGHVRSFVTHPQEYIQRVVQYFSRTLAPAVDEPDEVFAPV